MLTFAIVLVSIVAYLAVASWTLGYVAEEWDYRDRQGKLEPWKYPGAPTAAFFWPVSIVLIILKPMLAYMLNLGARRSEKQKQIQKFRIKAEEKLRIEQQRLEEEVEREIEEALRNAAKR